MSQKVVYGHYLSHSCLFFVFFLSVYEFHFISTLFQLFFNIFSPASYWRGTWEVHGLDGRLFVVLFRMSLYIRGFKRSAFQFHCFSYIILFLVPSYG